MSCEHVEELLSRFVEGDVAPDERRLVEEHAAVCEQCRKMLAAYRELESSLVSLREQVPPPHTVSARVTAGLGLERRRPALSYIFNVPVISTATAAVCFLLVYLNRGVVAGRLDAVGSSLEGAAARFPQWLTGWIIALAGGETWVLAAVFCGLTCLIALAGRLTVVCFAHR